MKAMYKINEYFFGEDPTNHDMIIFYGILSVSLLMSIFCMLIVISMIVA